MKQFLANSLRSAVQSGLLILKFVVPLYLLADILLYFDLLRPLGFLFAPVTSLLDLPPEAAVALAGGVLINIYAGIAFAAPLDLSPYQWTVLAVFLGVCHSMAHKIGAAFHIPHGLANALLISNVVRYNATDNPTKQTAFSQYDRPHARRRYAQIADHLGLGGARTGDKVAALLVWLDDLKTALDIPASIQAAGVAEADFLAQIDRIAVEAFDDQCTGTNPRFPLIAELKAILLDSYYGRPFVEATAPASAEPTKATRKAAE